MLSSLRGAFKGTTGRILVPFVIVVIILAFAFVGVPELRNFTQRAALKVGDTEYQARDIQDEFARQLDIYRRQTGESLTNEEALSAGLLAQTVNVLKGRSLIAEETNKLGLVATNSMVGDYLRANPAFANPTTGEFDQQYLIAILQALKVKDWGAGQTLAAYERQLADAAGAEAEGYDAAQPIKTVEMRVPTDWTDYNNHMTESRYLEFFGNASDALLRLIGVDADYVANGGSYFTVETHIRHLDEVAALEPVTVTTQVLEAKGKKLRLFHRLSHADGRLLATGEHLLLHVSLKTRSACEPPADIAAKAEEIAAGHAALDWPEGAGRAIGQPR